MQLSPHSIKNNPSRGFTILEVIVSLVIVGIAITAFIELLGNSTKFRSKLNEHDERLLVAITKAEQAFLGLLDGANAQSGVKLSYQGTTENKNINWQIEEEMDDSSEGDGEDAYFYTVSVDGIEISSVTIK